MADSRDIILDTEHLAAYTSGDVDLQVHVLQIFLENTPVYLSALSRENNSDWQADAHKLKGAARGVGALKIANLAEKAERMGSAANFSDKAAVLKQLELVMNETKSFIEVHYLQDRILY